MKLKRQKHWPESERQKDFKCFILKGFYFKIMHQILTKLITLAHVNKLCTGALVVGSYCYCTAFYYDCCGVNPDFSKWWYPLIKIEDLKIVQATALTTSDNWKLKMCTVVVNLEMLSTLSQKKLWKMVFQSTSQNGICADFQSSSHGTSKRKARTQETGLIWCFLKTLEDS